MIVEWPTKSNSDFVNAHLTDDCHIGECWLVHQKISLIFKWIVLHSSLKQLPHGWVLNGPPNNGSNTWVDLVHACLSDECCSNNYVDLVHAYVSGKCFTTATTVHRCDACWSLILDQTLHLPSLTSYSLVGAMYCYSNAQLLPILIFNYLLSGTSYYLAKAK